MSNIGYLCKSCTYGVYNPCSGGYNCELDLRDDYTPEDIIKICSEVEIELKEFLRYHE